MTDHTPDGVTGPPRSPRGEHPGPRIIQCWDRHYECTYHGGAHWTGEGWCYDVRRNVAWLHLVGSGELSIQDGDEPLATLRPNEWGHARLCPLCDGEGMVDGDDPGPDVECCGCHGGGLLTLVKPGTLGPVG